MNNERLQKRGPAPIKENAQAALAFGVIAALLYVVGFPVFAIVTLGVLSYFIWRMFLATSRSDTRRIFEFYLVASEILKEDARRWFGFEVQEAIARGLGIIKQMPSAPPLVHFTLGALYQKIGDHGSAAKYLAHVVDDGSVDEASIVFPSRELRDYVKMLRRIERAPAESPMTSAAIRGLERMRKNKAAKMLDEARAKPDETAQKQLAADLIESGATNEKGGSYGEGRQIGRPLSIVDAEESAEIIPISFTTAKEAKDSKRKAVGRRQNAEGRKPGRIPERKPISEVLRDIYDQNA